MDSLDTPMLSKKMSGFGSAFGESSPIKSFGSNRISLLKYQKKCSIDLLDVKYFHIIVRIILRIIQRGYYG